MLSYKEFPLRKIPQLVCVFDPAVIMQSNLQLLSLPALACQPELLS
jgi:hypothetical protein